MTVGFDDEVRKKLESVIQNYMANLLEDIEEDVEVEGNQD